MQPPLLSPIARISMLQSLQKAAGCRGLRLAPARASSSARHNAIVPRHQSPSASPLAASAAPAAAPTDAAAEGSSSLLPEALAWPSRSTTCGTLREGDDGKTVVLCGWVDRNRDMGGVQFMDLRDHTGIVQVRHSRRLHAHPMHAPMHASSATHLPLLPPILPARWCASPSATRRSQRWLPS